MMNLLIAQSGGPTCAINASLAGAFEAAAKSPEIDRIFGACNGVEGILLDNLVDLRESLQSEEAVDLLCRTPSTALGSCRYKLPMYQDDERPYREVHAYLERHGIGAFFYIGGNDSMDTVAKLSEYFHKIGSEIRILGIPKTIDNDLMHTDHTPGFGSAAKYVAMTLAEIAQDSAVYNVASVTIVEIMGRDAGWLTASSCVLHRAGLAAPHLIYLPETPFSPERFLNDIRRIQHISKSVIIAVSEGVQFSEGGYAVGDFQSGMNDAFGHKYLSGIGKCLEQLVRTKLGCKVRSIELNVMQRCSSHLASKTDIDESRMAGGAAVEAALAGNSGSMVTLVRAPGAAYAVTTGLVDASRVANHTRLFPAEWINEDGNNILHEAEDYFMPLIQGEFPPIMKNGIPVHFQLHGSQNGGGRMQSMQSAPL